MGVIRIVPTLIRLQVNKESHRLVAPKNENGKQILKIQSFFEFKIIKSEKKKELYENMLSGAQTGNMILPYMQEHPAEKWNYGKTSCDLEQKRKDGRIVTGKMQTTDRMLVFRRAREITEEELGNYRLFAEADVAKKDKGLTVYRTEDEYDRLSPGSSDESLWVLIRNFYGDKMVLFDRCVEKIPVPGQDGRCFIFADGSRTEDGKAGEMVSYNWGYLCGNRNKEVKAAVGNGRSTEWNAAAEKESCQYALEDNLCEWTKEDDVTVYFDCVNNAYSLLGWFSETGYSQNIVKLSNNFKSLTFCHIDAHTGAVGNELADSLANIELRTIRYNGLGEKGGVTLDTRHSII